MPARDEWHTKRREDAPGSRSGGGERRQDGLAPHQRPAGDGARIDNAVAEGKTIECKQALPGNIGLLWRFECQCGT